MSASAEGTRVTLPPPRETPPAATEATPTAAATASPQQPSPTGAPPPVADNAAEEDLLRDVLDELDKERSKRAQAEADFRHLAQEREALQEQLLQEQQRRRQLQQDYAQQQQRQQSTAAAKNEQAIVSRQAFMAMEAQVKGFQQLVDALTLGKPAIAAAAQQESVLSTARSASSSAAMRYNMRPQTLPLHVVRLLEVLPWDPRAQEHVFGVETIYEWQIYDPREQKWQSHLRYFPSRIKNLPIAKPSDSINQPEDGNLNSSSSHHNSADRRLLQFLAGGEKSPSKHGTWTDTKVSQILKMEAAYPLPQNGGQWEWVGGWRVDKRLKKDSSSSHATQTNLSSSSAPPLRTATTEKQRVDCDDNGWSYATNFQDFHDLPTELVWDSPGPDMSRRIRRRQWSRQRVLVDYPFISERTQQYLRLLAENAKLTITASKMADQLVETKTKLTECEESLFQYQSVPASAGIPQVVNDSKVNPKSEAASILSSTGSGGPPGKRIQEFLQKNEQVKEIGTKFSKWVARKASEDLTTTSQHDATPATGAGSAEEEDPSSPKQRPRAESDLGTLSSHGSVSESGQPPSASNPTSFPWRNVGRSGLMEKLAGKKNHGRTGGGASSSSSIGEELVVPHEHNSPPIQEAPSSSETNNTT